MRTAESQGLKKSLRIKRRNIVPFILAMTSGLRQKVPNAAADNTQNAAGKSKYDQYQAYGIELSSDGNTLYYNGQRVKLFLDILADGSAETYWTDDAGTVNLSAVRDANGQITSIAKISEEQAQKYLSALEEREKNSLDGLEEKVEAKVKEKFQDN